jgi:hypothetical protein
MRFVYACRTISISYVIPGTPTFLLTFSTNFQAAMKARNTAAIKLIMKARATKPPERPTREGMQCPICCDEFKEGEDGTCLPCNHYLHPGCMEEWLQKKDFCPLCRVSITGPESAVGRLTSDEACMGGHWRCIACTTENPDHADRCICCRVSSAAARVADQMQRTIFPRVVAIAIFHEVLHSDPDVTDAQRLTVEFQVRDL